MIKYLYIIPIILLAPHILCGQPSNNLAFDKLKTIHCEGVDENSSRRKQKQCMIIDVVLDSLNYFPQKTRKSDLSITSPDLAWKELRRLYPEFEDKEFNCWAEYHGYYVFSLNCNSNERKRKCSFICMIYIPIGGNEFWYFVPHT